MPAIHKLTSLALAKQRSPGYYGDGGGLMLQVSASGTKSWIFRYRLDGRRREMGLGPCSVVELAEARKLARRCRQLLHQGLDPLADRRDARTARAAKKARSIMFGPGTRSTCQGASGPSLRAA